MNLKKVLVTGGSGFIGSCTLRYLAPRNLSLANIDCLTYAGRRESLCDITEQANYTYLQIDIRDRDAVSSALSEFQPDVVMHLAAESHVDRSIDGPADFISTNVVGTFELLQAATEYWNQLSGSRKDSFRFHHISTDCLLYTSPSPRDKRQSRMPSSA